MRVRGSDLHHPMTLCARVCLRGVPLFTIHQKDNGRVLWFHTRRLPLCVLFSSHVSGENEEQCDQSLLLTHILLCKLSKHLTRTRLVNLLGLVRFLFCMIISDTLVKMKVEAKIFCSGCFSVRSAGLSARMPFEWAYCSNACCPLHEGSCCKYGNLTPAGGK